ncbi:hypothetical protein [Streptomyces sp. NPDC001401]|uniref:hypothetical protein n=1 Tax=Streptomyces sp. NPDC001401 TaxID=3364570 RepID=UPI0036A9C067
MVAAMVLAAGCGDSDVSLGSRPKDEDSGRDLARAVADHADCGSFEDYRLDAKDNWVFTCQKSDRLFGIRADVSPSNRADLIKKLRTEKQPYKAGHAFLVYEFQKSPGRANPAADLKNFPGTLSLPDS